MIEIHHLSKSFGGVSVLKDINLDIGAGEIHALVGANGSGKSTIVKALSGYHDQVDCGEITIRGVQRPLPIRAGEVHGLGISFVHQDLGLVEQMSLVDNVSLYAGYSTNRFGRINVSLTRAVAADVLHQLALDRSPETLVRDLGPTERVIVAVARATAAREQPGLLVLDEPTAAIPIDEIARIINVVRSRRKAGWAILYISHRLDEVLGLADRVSILRDGALVATRTSSELDSHELSEMIIGSTLFTREAANLILNESAIAATESEPQYQTLTIAGLRGRQLREINFSVAPGEIIGVTGPAGCGKSELGRILVGAERAMEGSVMLGTEQLNFNHPIEALDAGIGYVPQDRTRLSLIPKGCIRENISGLRLKSVSSRHRISMFLESARAKHWIGAFGINPTDEERPISSLSGGNQQKTVIARAFESARSLLVLDDPTAGVDVGARAQIQEIIRNHAASGLPIVLLSTEIDELVSLCHKVVILRAGIVSSVLSAPFTHEELARAIFAGHTLTQDVDNSERSATSHL